MSRRSPPTRPSSRAARPRSVAASSTAAIPRSPQHRRPVAHQLGQLVGERVAAGVELDGPDAHQAGQGGGADPRCAVRLLERLEHGQPLDRGRGREDAASAGDHGRDPHVSQGSARGGQVVVARGDHRDVARFEPPAVVRRLRGEERPDVAGEVAGDVGSDRRRPSAAASRGDPAVAGHHPEPDGRGDRCPDEPRLLVVGLDRPDHDLAGRRARPRRAAHGGRRRGRRRCDG